MGKEAKEPTRMLGIIRGAILEEIVLHLLRMVGFRIVTENDGEEGICVGSSGLEVEGRGEKHQIDALAAFDYTPSFMYPIRLLVEAKCHKQKVGIEVVRNAVGVLKDISENYFSTTESRQPSVKLQRYNYLSAIFSTSGFTENAGRFAIAHQIFLIQYERIPLLKPTIEGLTELSESHFSINGLNQDDVVKKTRQYARTLLSGELPSSGHYLSTDGVTHFNDEIYSHLQAIEGSYFGMLQGKWPIHLISNTPLRAKAFESTDNINSKLWGLKAERWSFVPKDVQRNGEEWFELFFDLPDHIADLVKAAKGDKGEVGRIKKDYCSYIVLSGKIGGVRRQIRLELDEDWIDGYMQVGKS